jgi:hypothetical protein
MTVDERFRSSKGGAEVTVDEEIGISKGWFGLTAGEGFTPSKSLDEGIKLAEFFS